MSFNHEYMNQYGLIRADKTGVSENCMLYSYEAMCLFHGIKNINNTEYNFYFDLVKSLRAYIRSCKISDGLFNQYPYVVETKEKYMSHDQLTSIMNFSYLTGTNDYIEIWQEIKRQWFRYDNVNPDKPSWGCFLHPRDIIYYAYLNKSWIGYVFFPILVCIMLYTMLNTKKVRPYLWDRIKTRLKTGAWPTKMVFFSTDGKLINFTRRETCDRLLMRVTFKLIDFMVKLKYGSYKLFFRRYFPEDHINVVLAEKAFNEEEIQGF